MYRLSAAARRVHLRSNSLEALSACLKSRQRFSTTSAEKGRNGSYWHGGSKIPLTFETQYAALRRTADRAGDTLAIAVQHQDIQKTYTDYLRDIDSLASGLLSLGHCYPGSLVAIFAPNLYEWTVAQFACAKIGAALVNINPAFQPPEIEYALNLCRAAVVIVGDLVHTPVDLYKIIASLAPELDSGAIPNDLHIKRLPFLRSIITIGSESRPGAVRYPDVLANSHNSELRARCEKIHGKLDADLVSSVQFTSGTTGNPKGVPLTHHNVVNNARTFGARIGLNKSNTTVLLNVPLFHCFGCVVGSLACAVHGATLVLPAPRFNANASLDAINKYKCTIVYGTPTMYIDMLANIPQNASFPSLDKCVAGGAIVPVELIQRINDVIGIPVWPAYGATELSPVVASATPTKNGHLPQLGLDHIEIKVVDSSDTVVEFGQRGELCSRGYQVFQGYLHQPEKTAEVIKNGWYHTGDEAIMSPEGHITITGRVKDMIIRGGENIYPAEIENFLLTINEIEEAHVFGVPDQRMGEEVAVWVKLRPNRQLTTERLRTMCKGKLSHFKIPRYVEFVSDFPQTLSGKIKKFVMRKEMSKKLKLTEIS